MTEQIIAAIIGYWRSGATDEEIAEITGYPVILIERIINNHINKDT